MGKIKTGLELLISTAVLVLLHPPGSADTSQRPEVTASFGLEGTLRIIPLQWAGICWMGGGCAHLQRSCQRWS